MMSGAAPIVSDGITSKFSSTEEKLHLPAFALTFAVALLMYSPCFTARNVAIRTIKDRRSMARTCQVYLIIATASASLMYLTASWAPLTTLVFKELLGGSAESTELARQGLLCFLPCPFLLVLRAMAQACHIINRKTWIVGVGSLMRLSAMALFVYLYAIKSDLNGPVLGGLTFVCGMFIECLTNIFFLKGAPQLKSESEAQLLSFGHTWKYVLPLVFALYLTKMMTPLTFNIMKETAYPEESLGGYQLYHSTMWISLSLIFSAQPIIIKYANSKANLKKIFIFNLYISLFITFGLAILTYTILKDLFYVDFMKVDNKIILKLLYESLPLTLLLPLINLMTLFLNALHTRSGHTMWITVSTTIGLIPVYCIKFIDLSDQNGTLISVICYLVFYISSLAVQLFGLKKYGVEKCLTENVNINKKEKRVKKDKHD